LHTSQEESRYHQSEILHSVVFVCEGSKRLFSFKTELQENDFSRKRFISKSKLFEYRLEVPEGINNAFQINMFLATILKYHSLATMLHYLLQTK